MQADRSTMLVRRSWTEELRQQRAGGCVKYGEITWRSQAQSQNGPQPEGPASATTSQPAPAPAAEQARPTEQEYIFQLLVEHIRSAAEDFDVVSSTALQPLPRPTPAGCYSSSIHSRCASRRSGVKHLDITCRFLETWSKRYLLLTQK